MAPRLVAQVFPIALVAFPALAADIVLTPPAAGGVSVTNAAGNTTRFRVADDGSVTFPEHRTALLVKALETLTADATIRTAAAPRQTK